MYNKIFVGLVGLSIVVTSSTNAQDWPRFRGPDGNGVVKKLEHPESWSDSKNIAWKINLPGGGLSSPVVSNGLIFVTSAVGAPIPKNFAGGVSNMTSSRNPWFGPIERDFLK